MRLRKLRNEKVKSVGNTNYSDFNGAVRVTQYGKSVHHHEYGYSSYTLDVPMSSRALFPIGSNTKLFAAVAIYQLQEAGTLNVSDPIAQYLNKSDFEAFGFSNMSSYCPVLYGDSTNACQELTFVHLLSMGSGIIDEIDCDYSSDSPFVEYCWDVCQMWWDYEGSLAWYVGTFINDPLSFEPGSSYSYSNLNFIFAGYLIEKLSGMPFEEYLDKYIVSVLDLPDTYYDAYMGVFGAHKGRVDEYYLLRDADDTSKQLGTGWCRPTLHNGVASLVCIHINIRIC